MIFIEANSRIPNEIVNENRMLFGSIHSFISLVVMDTDNEWQT